MSSLLEHLTKERRRAKREEREIAVLPALAYRVG